MPRMEMTGGRAVRAHRDEDTRTHASARAHAHSAADGWRGRCGRRRRSCAAKSRTPSTQRHCTGVRAAAVMKAASKYLQDAHQPRTDTDKLTRMHSGSWSPTARIRRAWGNSSAWRSGWCVATYDWQHAALQPCSMQHAMLRRCVQAPHIPDYADIGAPFRRSPMACAPPPALVSVAPAVQARTPRT